MVMKLNVKGITQRNQEMKILNIGCGLDKYGTDRIDKIKTNNTTCVGDIEELGLPYKDNSFDEVYSRCVLEHMKNPFNLILEMKRVCKPNGKIIIITDNAFWIQRHEHGDVPFTEYQSESDKHYYLFHYSHLKNLFNEAGIEVIDGGYKEFELFSQEKGLSPTSLRSKLFRKLIRLFSKKKGYPHVWIRGRK